VNLLIYAREVAAKDLGYVELIGSWIWPAARRDIPRIGDVCLLAVRAQHPNGRPWPLAARQLGAHFDVAVREVERLPLDHG
jgi:hypothetical protein